MARAAAQVPDEVQPVEDMAELDALGALDALNKPRDLVVASTVPQAVQEFVEREYGVWRQNPAIWREVTFPSQAAAENIVTQARAYTRERDPNLTFQVKSGYPHDGILAYRVRDKMRRKTTAV